MTGTTPRLKISSIDKGFYGIPVLKDVTFDVAPGSIVGLVGENGAGKTTLMNIVAGVLPSEGGTLALDGEEYAPANPIDADRNGVVFVHQELNLFPNLSIEDNFFLTAFPSGKIPRLISRSKTRKAARVLLERIGLDRDPATTVDLLSPGERQQVEIAKALQGEPRVLILDEPTTSLTARETERLFAVIREISASGTSVIYISHILGDVMDLCDEVVVLRDGELVASGPTSGFTISSMIGAMVGRTLDQMYPTKTSVVGENIALDVRGVSEPGTVKDISFTVREGEVVGVFGLMGAGRSEMARIVFGLDPCRSGSVLVGGRERKRSNARASISRGLGFVTEDRRNEGLLMSSTVVDNIGLAVLPRFTSKLGIVRSGAIKDAALTAGKRINLKAANPARQEVKALSGGNQQKAVIAKWMLTEPQVLILDEPTRGIDVGAKHEVYTVVDELAAKNTGVLVISSEVEELMGICDRVLVMRAGEIVAEFDGPDYEKRELLAAAFGELPS